MRASKFLSLTASKTPPEYTFFSFRIPLPSISFWSDNVWKASWEPDGDYQWAETVEYHQDLQVFPSFSGTTTDASSPLWYQCEP